MTNHTGERSEPWAVGVRWAAPGRVIVGWHVRPGSGDGREVPVGVLFLATVGGRAVASPRPLLADPNGAPRSLALAVPPDLGAIWVTLSRADGVFTRVLYAPQSRGEAAWPAAYPMAGTRTRFGVPLGPPRPGRRLGRRRR